MKHEAHERRPNHLVVTVERERVHIRDQRPLHAGCIDSGNLSFADVVRVLNDHVYFWPGDSDGPIQSGRNHFARYAGESEHPCVVLAFPTRSVLELNAERIRFSRCNSGAPRMNKGQRQPRGASTFRTLSNFTDTAGAVVEVTCEAFAELPWDTVGKRSVREFVTAE